MSHGSWVTRLRRPGAEGPGTRRTAKRLFFASILLFASCFATWLLWGSWPDPRREPIPWVPDAIVVPGGGDPIRAARASRLATIYPEIPVIISGDGGYMETILRGDPATRGRLVIEPDATSTWQNATLTKPLLKELQVSRAVIVTNWFHVPRATAVFRKAVPEVEWMSDFAPALLPLPPWDLGCERRERLAAIWYLLRYGVNSFGSN